MSWEIIGLIGLEICLWPWFMNETSEKSQSSTQYFSRHAEARHMRESLSWRLLSVGPELEALCCVAYILLIWIFGLTDQLCCGSWAEKVTGQLSGHHPQASSLRGRCCNTMYNLPEEESGLAWPDLCSESKAVLKCALTFLWRTW